MIKAPLSVLAIAGVLLASGCVRQLPEVGPADIPRLEEALARDPGNPELLTRLGMAQFAAQRYFDAEAALLQAVRTGEAPASAHLYLGLVRENREEWAGAREAYRSYLEANPEGPGKEEIQRRLLMVNRRELRAQTRAVLAREEEVSATEPTPGTVAVFPFRLTTENEDLLPLQVALADMMTTDLTLSGALTVLERSRVQVLLDEMALAEAGFTDTASGARAGRLLQAEHVIQGALQTLPDTTLELATDVLSTAQRESRGEATARRALEQLFDLEKEAVFEVLDILQVELTPAEREAIDENRAGNLLAFLAYGRGLMALDRDDYAMAREYFDQALAEDPGFLPAQEARMEASALTEALDTGIDDLAGRAMSELSPSTALPPAEIDVTSVGGTSATLQDITNEIAPTPGLAIVEAGPVSSGSAEQGQTRDPTQEAGRQEGVTTPATASIRITIPRPGGGS